MKFNEAMVAIERLGYNLCGASVLTETSRGVPANTYMDKELTTLHTNPIILDSDGWASEIYSSSAFMARIETHNGDFLSIGVINGIQ